MKFDRLLSPGKIGRLEIKNRVVMPPMGTGYADEEGFVTERLARYYQARSEGGTGLIIVEVAAVAPEGRAIQRQIGIWADKFIPGLRYLADLIKTKGARAAIQLHHAGRQTGSQTTGYQPVAPSAIPCPVCKDTPRELGIDEIKGLVNAFSHAARRAREAGFEAVELHGTHGYLINQFLSPHSNKRQDEYGGNWDKRLRFPREVVEAVRAAVGEDYPIIYRMNANEYVDGGLTVEDGQKFAGILEQWGVDALHVSAGVYGSPAPIIATMTAPELPLAEYASAVNELVDLPVIAVGKFHDPGQGETFLKEKRSDFVSVGRGLLTDSHYVKKLEMGQIENIRKCIQCNQLCVDRLLAYGRPVSCIYNARVGKEVDYPLEKARHSKKVVVVGAGPAGLEAARVAGERGHQVVIFEEGSELGGQGILAKIAPGKDRFGEILRYLIYRMKALGVDIRKGISAGPETIRQEKPDAVILATGAVPVIPELPGFDVNQAVTAWDVLRGKALPGKRAAIVGGGLVGCETAEFLAEKGHHITLLDLAGELARDQAPTLRGELLKRLHDNPSIEILTGAAVTETGNRSITYRKDGVENTLDEVDTTIIAVGARPYNPLEGQLKADLIDVYAVGDCDRARNAADAIHEAFQVAYRI